MESVRKKQVVLAAVTIAALAPFLNKAFHIDDPLFVWMAKQIAQHPFDPYGFSLVWGEPAIRPMWQNMLNPPLCSYFIALVGSIAGWSEIALHAAFLFVAVTAVLGMFSLAQRFCSNALAAALLALFTPVFLVSATNVMCDVMLLAFWIWAIERWLMGLEGDRALPLFFASALATAAMLTKYFGISVVPLLVVYTFLRKPHAWPRLAFLIIPLLATLAYEFVTRRAYGGAMFSTAATYLTPISGYGGALPAQLMSGLVFAGGCLCSAIFFVPLRDWRFLLVAVLVLAIAAFSIQRFIPIPPEAAENRIAILIQGTLFAAIGVWVLALAIVDLARERNADSLLLFLWIAGTFTFAAFVNWAITARTFLPMVPAAAILIVRHFDRSAVPRSFSWIGLAAAMAISLFVTAADYTLANTGRTAARTFHTKFSGESGAVWFYGHWGFQYYIEQWGAKPLTTDTKTSPNDVLIIAESYPDDPAATDRKVATAERITFPALSWIATLSRPGAASFYLHGIGPLPWAIGKVPPESYYIARLSD